ncbi:unnamed protein product [Linum trigynum]|uniref:Uncharacterized protein n=1 Tax=Linum trigynum TaxID=586398 RepID=A0AAV2G282_9ROSI
MATVAKEGRFSPFIQPTHPPTRNYIPPAAAGIQTITPITNGRRKVKIKPGEHQSKRKSNARTYDREVQQQTETSPPTKKYGNLKRDKQNREKARGYQNAGGEGVGRPAVGEGAERDLGGGVLGLAERGAVGRALEDLAVEVDRGLEARRVVGTFPDASVGGKVEAAPLRQLLQLVLVHFFPPP